MEKDFFKDFYSPGESHSSVRELSKSTDQSGFYKETDVTRDLSKGRNTDMAAVLEHHMKKASEAERAKGKKKRMEDL